MSRSCAVVPAVIPPMGGDCIPARLHHSGIRPTEIAAWLDSRGVTDSTLREWYHVLIEDMDAVFLEVENSG